MRFWIGIAGVAMSFIGFFTLLVGAMAIDSNPDEFVMRFLYAGIVVMLVGLGLQKIGEK